MNEIVDNSELDKAVATIHRVIVNKGLDNTDCDTDSDVRRAISGIIELCYGSTMQDQASAVGVLELCKHSVISKDASTNTTTNNPIILNETVVDKQAADAVAEMVRINQAAGLYDSDT